MERPREGVWAWLRRNTPWVNDPEPIEVTETTKEDGMTLRDMELLAVYDGGVRAVPESLTEGG